jgi:hypothetical protein
MIANKILSDKLNKFLKEMNTVQCNTCGNHFPALQTGKICHCGKWFCDNELEPICETCKGHTDFSLCSEQEMRQVADTILNLIPEGKLEWTHTFEITESEEGKHLTFSTIFNYRIPPRIWSERDFK